MESLFLSRPSQMSQLRLQELRESSPRMDAAKDLPDISEELAANIATNRLAFQPCWRRMNGGGAASTRSNGAALRPADLRISPRSGRTHRRTGFAPSQSCWF